MTMLPMILAIGTGTGSALQFSGDSQIVVVAHQSKLDLKEATVEAWIFVDSNDRFYNYVLCHNYGPLGYGVAIHGRPVKVFSQADQTVVPLGQWTHFAISASQKSEKVYVNGELAAARERGGPLQPVAKPLMIGNSDFYGTPGNEPTPFRGVIDEVRIWSKPMTQVQIRARMGRYLRGSERNLVAYFPFEEGAGQIVHDYARKLTSGSLGRTFQVDEGDPAWTSGVSLSGRLPKLR